MRRPDSSWYRVVTLITLLHWQKWLLPPPLSLFTRYYEYPFTPPAFFVNATMIPPWDNNNHHLFQNFVELAFFGQLGSFYTPNFFFAICGLRSLHNFTATPCRWPQYQYIPSMYGLRIRTTRMIYKNKIPPTTNNFYTNKSGSLCVDVYSSFPVIILCIFASLELSHYNTSTITLENKNRIVFAPSIYYRSFCQCALLVLRQHLLFAI